MVVKLDYQLNRLDGTPIEGDEGHAGKLVGRILAGQNQGNSIKLWDWALKLYNKQNLEIDSTDVKVLIGLIEADPQTTVLAKAQILPVLKLSETDK
jgi:hypothetical protein